MSASERPNPGSPGPRKGRNARQIDAEPRRSLAYIAAALAGAQPAQVVAITGTTLALVAAEMRAGAVRVAAGTPKNGTNSASLMPKSMSGNIKNPYPSRIARMIGLTPSARDNKRTKPKIGFLILKLA